MNMSQFYSFCKLKQKKAEKSIIYKFNLKKDYDG